MVQDDAVTEALYAREPAFRRSVEYLSRNASAPLYCNTQSEYYPMGQDFFARFLEVIRGAKKYIFMEYFIVEEGEMWNETLAVLKEKAAAGVDVRLIYDGFGSMFTLPGDYDEEIRRAASSAMYSIRCIFRCISLTIKCSTTETTARSPSWTVKQLSPAG